MKSPSLKQLGFVAYGVATVGFIGVGMVTLKQKGATKQLEVVQKSYNIMANYNPARVLLGPPIAVKAIKFTDPQNMHTNLKAQLAIPLEGRLAKGYLYTWASRDSEDDDWLIEKCDIEVTNKRWPFFISPQVSTQRLEEIENVKGYATSIEHMNMDNEATMDFSSDSKSPSKPKPTKQDNEELFYLQMKKGK